MFEQDRDVAVRLGMADEKQFSAVGGGQADVQHLEGRQFFDHDPGVSPVPEPFSIWRKVVIRQYARKETKRCASIRSALW